MTQYRGRFAPSPTGRLHFGSLVSAVASYARARSQSGVWLVRIEDIDRPREVPGAARRILSDLAAFGMVSDEPVVYQSQRLELYDDALDALGRADRSYPCGCTRRELAGARIYPGHCADGLPAGKAGRSIRFRCINATTHWDDVVQGPQQENVLHETGDFVVHRADGIHAYQLAVVVDDAQQRVTEVVRGCDLIDSTARQVQIQTALGLPTPRYLHHPVAVDQHGAKLSKSSGALPVLNADTVMGALLASWHFLGQASPAAKATRSVTDFWDWAIAHFDPNAMRGQPFRPVREPSA